MRLLIFIVGGIANLGTCSVPPKDVQCRSDTCRRISSRAPSLVQSRMQRTPGLLMNATTNTADAEVKGRKTLAVVQADSKKSNCSGQGEDPCLPLEKFTEAAQPHAPSERPVKFSRVFAAPEAAAAAAAAATGNMEASLSAVGSVDKGRKHDEVNDMEVGDMMPFELHLQDVSLEALLVKYSREDSLLPPIQKPLSKNSRGASLADLLQLFRSEIASAGNISTDRIVMNSIHGRFVRPSKESMLLNVGDTSKRKVSKILRPVMGSRGVSAIQDTPANVSRLGEEVLIRFFYMPAADSEQAAREVINDILSAMKDPKSKLMNGKLSDLLQRASITVGYKENYDLYAAPQERLASLALPFAISALFAGCLIWLTSF